MTGIPDDLNYGSRMYDKLGNPISLMIWGELHADYDYIVVAKDTLVINGIPLEVSTVWLGIDHNFGQGPPVIFETMVFGPETLDYCQRYCTEAEAVEGHAATLRKLAVLAENEPMIADGPSKETS